MRYIFLFFGFVFFAMVFAVGIWAERSFALVVRDACLSALVGALAGQWFWQRVVAAMRHTFMLKHAAMLAAAKLAREKKSTPVAPRSTKAGRV